MIRLSNFISKKEILLLLFVPMLLSSMGQRVGDFNSIWLSNTNQFDSQYKPMNTDLLVQVWKESIPKGDQPFGLNYTPQQDPNAYFVYHHELTNLDAAAELGVSLNNFTIVTLKYVHTFSLEQLIK